MTSKERIINTINLKRPDRIPVIVNLSPFVAKRLIEFLDSSVSAEPVKTLNTLIAGRVSYNELLCELGNDCIGVAPTVLENNISYHDDGSYTDEWGVTYSTINGYLEATKRPLAEIESISELDKYIFPDPEIEDRYVLARQQITSYGNDFAVMGCLGQTMFEMAWNLIGFEKFLIDLTLKEKYIMELLDRLIEYSAKYAGKLVSLGCDIIFLGDDVGMQNGMLISDHLWREIFKPRMKNLCDSIISQNPNIKIAYHSCGSITPIIDDLIEIGINILNPIQPLAAGMQLAELKRRYGTKLCLYGGIDVQRCIPSGTTEEIQKEVMQAIESAGYDGGYIIAPAHIIPAETKVINVLTFFDAVQLYGNLKIG